MTADACDGWSAGACEGTPHCPPRCPRFVDARGEAVLVLPLEGDVPEALVETYATFDRAHRSMGLPPVGEGPIREWLEWLCARGTSILAWREDRVAGHAAYAPDDARVPEFLVYVHPEFHGRGLGTELTKHAIALASARGHDGLVLEVERDNAVAVAVYEKLGFEVVERHPVELEMRLPFSDPIAERVRLPPAARA